MPTLTPPRPFAPEQVVVLPPPTYPARPVNGGRYELRRRKFGRWFYEPKLNGWRALVHTPTGRMWNRHGQPLTIGPDFAVALDLLRGLPCGTDWLDVEGLERRHALMQGSLVVLDALIPGLDYVARRNRLEACLDLFDDRWIKTVYADNPTACLVPCVEETHAVTLYARLFELNARLGVEFFEGLVAKRGDKPYPFQLRKPGEEYPYWMKHRFIL